MNRKYRDKQQEDGRWLLWFVKSFFKRLPYMTSWCQFSASTTSAAENCRTPRWKLQWFQSQQIQPSVFEIPVTFWCWFILIHWWHIDLRVAKTSKGDGSSCHFRYQVCPYQLSHNSTYRAEKKSQLPIDKAIYSGPHVPPFRTIIGGPIFVVYQKRI